MFLTTEEKKKITKSSSMEIPPQKIKTHCTFAGWKFAVRESEIEKKETCSRCWTKRLEVQEKHRMAATALDIY